MKGALKKSSDKIKIISYVWQIPSEQIVSIYEIMEIKICKNYKKHQVKVGSLCTVNILFYILN